MLVGLGIALLTGRSFSLRIPTPRQRGDGSQLLSVFVFGVSYALVSLSCTIPLFIAAVAPSFTDANFASGVAAFLAYGLGMGVVLIALTVALALAKHSLVRNLRRVLPYIYKVSGVLLVVAGALRRVLRLVRAAGAHGRDVAAAAPAQVVFDWNASISNWVQQIGPVRLGIVLAAAVGVVVALTMGTRRRPEPADLERTEPDRVEEPTDGTRTPAPCSTSCSPTPGSRRSCALRSSFGFMAFHGGSLEQMTDDIAVAAAELGGASVYAVVQPPGFRWHLPSTQIDPAHSAALTAFLDHVDVAVAVHGFGRQDMFTTLLLGGQNRELGRHVGHQPAGARCPSTTSSTTSTASPGSCAACTPTTRSTGPARAACSSSCRPGCAASARSGRTSGPSTATTGTRPTPRPSSPPWPTPPPPGADRPAHRTSRHGSGQSVPRDRATR